MKSIEKLWNDIAKFETGERKNDSQNQLQANARQSARMEAYVNLMEREIDSR